MRAIPGAVKDALSDARYGRDLMHRCKMDTPGWARGYELWDRSRAMAGGILLALRALRRQEEAGILGIATKR